MRRLFDTLRVQLVLLVVLALMPSLGLAVYTATVTRNHEVFEAERDAAHHARQIAGSYDDMVDGTRELLIALAQLRPLREADSRACNNLLPNLLKQFPRYVNLAVAAPDGQPFCSGIPLSELNNVADRDYFRRAVESRGFAVGQYEAGGNSDSGSVVFAFPVLEEGGGVLGVILALLDLAWLNRLVPEADLPNEATVMIIDRNAVIVARWPNPQSWVGKSLPDAPLVKTMLARKESAAEFAGLDGVQRLHAFAPLGQQAQGLYVSVGVPTSALFAEADHSLVNSLGALAVVGLMVLGLALGGSQLLVLGRVSALVRAATRLGRGDLGARTDLSHQAGELGMLAESFDRMAESLERREAERQGVEVRLRDAETRYRSLFEQSPDGIVVIDAQSGLPLEFNDVACQQLGYTKEEFSRLRLNDYEAVESPEETAAHLEKVLRQGDTFETKHRRKDGTLMDVLVSAKAIHFGAKPACYAVFRDITERMRAVEAMRASQERYRTLIETSPDAIVVIDLEGSPILANQKAVALSGSSNAEEVIGRQMMDFFAPDDGAHAAEVLRETIEVGQVRDFNVNLLSKGGGATPVEINTALMRDAEGNPQALLAIIRDVTERREAEERVRLEAERTAALLRSAARLTAQMDWDGLLSAICEEAAQALNVPAATLSLYNSEDDALHVVQAFGAPRDIMTSLAPIPRASFESTIGEKGRAVVIPHLAADAPDKHFPEEFKAPTVALAAIRREDRLIGALTAVSLGQHRDFSENELALLRGLADQAAQAISNARLAEDTKRRLHQVQALHAIDMAITGSLDLRVILNVFLDQTTALLGADAANVLVLDPRTQTLKFVAGRGFRTAALQHTRLRLGEGNAGRAALERRVVTVPSLSENPDGLVRAPLLAEEGFVTYCAAPLIAKGQVQGTLEIFHRTPVVTDREYLDLVDSLATQAAIAIDNASLFDELQRSNVDLTLAYDNTLEGWSRALDLRDRETEGHSRRVTDMTVRLAHALGISADEMVHIRRGALLHDIGKMGIPDAILLKTGALTEDEKVVMRRHPVLAYELLSPIPFLRPALDVPYCHHEKWDGTGYPRGLKGEQIPLAARIFALVDVFDALASDRPYRSAWPAERIHQHLRSRAGTHFDPAVVEKFFEVAG